MVVICWLALGWRVVCRLKCWLGRKWVMIGLVWLLVKSLFGGVRWLIVGVVSVGLVISVMRSRMGCFIGVSFSVKLRGMWRLDGWLVYWD